MEIRKKATCCCQSGDCKPATPAGRPVYVNPKGTQPFITGFLDTKAGQIPLISTHWDRADRWGLVKVRWGLGRMKYRVEPGLYGVGEPTEGSEVFVTANYKLSFDLLRRELAGLDAWILVLDTKGINVWCAAGKGTFGTDELVKRIELSGLKDVIGHRRLIVPQLGAVGVAAHEVKKQSGFSVVYGPVRAVDIPGFLAASRRAEPGMRRVTFNFFDRLRVIPVEAVQGAKLLLLVMAAFAVVSGISPAGYSFRWGEGIRAALNILVAYVAGNVLSPLLLPWVPGRSFSLKGAQVGLLAFIGVYLAGLAGHQPVPVLAWLLLIPALSSFLAMNYTGCSTYTSLSGVKKEMRLAVPLQVGGAAVGLVLWVAGRFV